MSCDMAADTAWDTVLIWEQKWPATWVIPVFTAGMPARSWLEFNFRGMLAVKLYDGSSSRRRMFSFVWEVAQVVPAAYENQALHINPGFSKSGFERLAIMYN